MATSALRVNPTRMELTRIKRRLVTAVRGHKLLKDKRDEMVRQFILLVRENHRLRQEVETELAAALGNFAMARAVIEPEMMEEALLCPARSIGVDMGVRSILSVRVPTLTTTEEHTQTTLSYGLAETSAQLDGAIESLADLLPKMIHLAEVEKACNLLADEIEKTRRRVNALEYVMIPQFQETIRFIAMKLDENERGSLTRLMKVKNMIEQRAEKG
ncbi:MAG TPA: V-type ATP synthase subunit D [Candidatus Limiplasma sp.]|nr:V-type ATP synthase subunit D [Candidatus Limiplasma sp.]HPS80364.1 V-type ATP synthase subunit D [Candidatus Limiplasma sp.]